VAEKARHPPERLIARGVPLPIVDPFQVVDVGDQHRELVSGTQRARSISSGQADVGVTSVPEAGQRVLVGCPPITRSLFGHCPRHVTDGHFAGIKVPSGSTVTACPLLTAPPGSSVRERGA
jgi:hypothetical protein